MDRWMDGQILMLPSTHHHLNPRITLTSFHLARPPLQILGKRTSVFRKHPEFGVFPLSGICPITFRPCANPCCEDAASRSTPHPEDCPGACFQLGFYKVLPVWQSGWPLVIVSLSGICGFTDISRMSFLALSHKLSKICKETQNFAVPVLLACCKSLLPPTQIYFPALYKLLEVGFASPNSVFLPAKHRYSLEGKINPSVECQRASTTSSCRGTFI